MNDEQNALLSKNKWKQSERARQTNPDQTRPGVHNVHKLSQAQPMLKQKKAGEKRNYFIIKTQSACAHPPMYKHACICTCANSNLSHSTDKAPKAFNNLHSSVFKRSLMQLLFTIIALSYFALAFIFLLCPFFALLNKLTFFFLSIHFINLNKDTFWCWPLHEKMRTTFISCHFLYILFFFSVKRH